MLRKIGLAVLIVILPASAAFSWSTGIGIIDNNVPAVVKDPGVILKDPTHAVLDLAAKTGCYRCDTVIEKAIPEKQRQIANAVLTTGFVTSPLGPLGTVITLGVLVQSQPNAEAQNRQVPIQTEKAPPGKEYTLTSDCLVQRPDRIEAYFLQDPQSVAPIQPGDFLTISAKVCDAYNVGDVKSITSVRMKLSGASSDPFAKLGKEFKYFYVGSVA